MPRPNLSSPLSILLAGVLVILLLLASTSASTRAISSHLASTATLTPCLDDDSDAALDCQDERSFMTADAEDALTAAAEAYPYDAPSVTTTSTQASVTATRGSPTTTTTTTGSPTGSSVAATTTRTSPNASTDTIPTTEAGIASGAGTPPPTPTPEMNLNCVPGIPVMITGTGPAHAPLLLFFDQRPVGGGSASANGSFALKLVVGRERPGEYQVAVRVRGTSRVVRELTCTVPSIPTPIAYER